MAHCELPVLRWPGAVRRGDPVPRRGRGRAAAPGWLARLDAAVAWAKATRPYPANMVDFAQRERRWCQGNLQHVGVLPTRGLRPVGRYHLALGVLHYSVRPACWWHSWRWSWWTGCWADISSSTCSTSQAGLRNSFVGLTFLLLYAAKFCSLGIAALANDKTACPVRWPVADAGSAPRSSRPPQWSAAPVLLVFYTRFIGMMLLGRTVRWDAQPRDDRGVSWSRGGCTGCACPPWLDWYGLPLRPPLAARRWRWSATLAAGPPARSALRHLDQLSDARLGRSAVRPVPHRG